MKKIALSLVMSCALLASSAVMAQDAKSAKPKTETSKSCCSKDKKACTGKSDVKKTAPTKEAKK